MVDYNALFLDYCTVTPEDDDQMRAFKEAVASLSEVDRRIWLLYCELGSYSALARFLRNSPPTAKKRVVAIREKILNYDDI